MHHGAITNSHQPYRAQQQRAVGLPCFEQARGPRHKMALSGIPEIIFLHFVPVKVIYRASSEHTKCLRAASAPVPRLTQYDLQSAAFSCVKLEEFLADPVGI